VMGGWLDWVILWVFSNLGDSMVILLNGKGVVIPAKLTLEFLVFSFIIIILLLLYYYYYYYCCCIVLTVFHLHAYTCICRQGLPSPDTVKGCWYGSSSARSILPSSI